MAIILVGGNAVEIPKSIFDKVRPLTSNIALEMGYATESHQELYLQQVLYYLHLY